MKITIDDSELDALVERIARRVVALLPSVGVSPRASSTRNLKDAVHPVTGAPLGPADKQYGYTFGCEGVLSLNDAIKALGGISRFTIDRQAAKGLIRKGKHPDGGRVIYCLRSVRELISRSEQ